MDQRKRLCFEVVAFTFTGGLTLLGGFLVSISIAHNLVWYQNLTQPSWAIPCWGLSLAWAFMYLLITISAFMVFRIHNACPTIAAPLIVHFVHLALIFAYTPVFFELKQIELAITLIVLIFIVAMVAAVLFGRLNIWSSLLMVPYLLWLLYVVSLDVAIAVLNPKALRVHIDES